MFMGSVLLLSTKTAFINPEVDAEQVQQPSPSVSHDIITIQNTL